MFKSVRLTFQVQHPEPEGHRMFRNAHHDSIHAAIYVQPRSGLKVAGWEVLVAWPVDDRPSGFGDGMGWDLTRNLFVLNTAIREQVRQLACRSTGR